MSSSESDESTVIASATTNIKWFFIITLVYFTIKHVAGVFTFMGELILFVCYYIIIIITQTIINIENSKHICGSSQGVIFSTMISWVLVFGIFIFMLMIFPGWNIPFSQSIGYSIAQFAGADFLLRKVINRKIMIFDEEGQPDRRNSTETQQKILELYVNDPSYLINEIPLELNTNGEWIFWSTDSLIDEKFKDNQNSENIKLRDKLYNLLYIKESTAHFIWYTLIGILACLINFNYILTSDCVKSMEQIDETVSKQKESTMNSSSSSTIYNTSGIAMVNN